MKRVLAVGLAAAFLTAAVPAVTHAAGSDRAKSAYFVDANPPKFTRTALVVRGHRLGAGYVVNGHGRCKGYPHVKGWFIDFSEKPIRDGRFVDIDAYGFGRDVVRGKRVGTGRIEVKARGVADFRGPGPKCKFRSHAELKKVDRVKWRRYTKEARKLDPNFPDDHRELGVADARGGPPGESDSVDPRMAPPSVARERQPTLRRATLIQKDGPPRLRFRATSTSKRTRVYLVGDRAEAFRAQRTDAKHWLVKPSSRQRRSYLEGLIKNVRRSDGASVLASIANRSSSKNPTPVGITFFRIEALNKPTFPQP